MADRPKRPSDRIDEEWAPLTVHEQGDCTSELRWRKSMFREARRQTLLLEEILAHFKTWAVEDPGQTEG